jgi:hypothetical protein
MRMIDAGASMPSWRRIARGHRPGPSSHPADPLHRETDAANRGSIRRGRSLPTARKLHRFALGQFKIQRPSSNVGQTLGCGAFGEGASTAPLPGAFPADLAIAQPQAGSLMVCVSRDFSLIGVEN